MTAGAARLRLGTRGSPLALRQSGLVAAEIERRGTSVELVAIRTSGDVASGSLATLGGKGLFVKEIEQALSTGEIDLAVHSLKDMPADLPPGLILAATPPRADPRDVLITSEGRGLGELLAGTRIGTSSLRRRALIAAVRPDLEVVPLRGNVETRLGKLAAFEVDAVILAAAGLARLGLQPNGAVPLPVRTFVPAIGQGILALETRADDRAANAVVARLDDPATHAAAAAERAFLAAVGGDCHTPLAAYAEVTRGRVRLTALVADPDGRALLGDTLEGDAAEAPGIGRRLAEALLSRGASDIVARARRQHA